MTSFWSGDLGQDIVGTSWRIEADASVAVGFDPSDLARRAGEGKGGFPGRCPPASFNRNIFDEEVGFTGPVLVAAEEFHRLDSAPAADIDEEETLVLTDGRRLLSFQRPEEARDRLGHGHRGPDRQVLEHQLTVRRRSVPYFGTGRIGRGEANAVGQIASRAAIRRRALWWGRFPRGRSPRRS